MEFYYQKIEEVDLKLCREQAKAEMDLPFETAYCVLEYVLKLEKDFQALVTENDSLKGIVDSYPKL